MGQRNPVPFLALWIAGFITGVGCYCGSQEPLLPPCPPSYHLETCSVLINGTAVQQEQCYLEKKEIIQWPYWVVAGAIGLILVVTITLWKYSRDTSCYQNCKDEIRHKKNRVVARWCVAHICQCKCCIACCEPYTRPTIYEIQEQRDLDQAASTELNVHAHYHETFQPDEVIVDQPHRKGDHKDSIDESHSQPVDSSHNVHEPQEKETRKCVHPQKDVGKTLDECTASHIILA